MKNVIQGIDKAKKALGDFEFSEFRIVRELRFCDVGGESRQSHVIDLLVESETRAHNFQLKMIFYGVTGLCVNNFGGGQTRIIGLDIIDVSDRQWEGVMWEVIDFENGAIKFRAKAVEIASVVQITDASPPKVDK